MSTQAMWFLYLSLWTTSKWKLLSSTFPPYCLQCFKMVVLPSESVDQILKCNHSKESHTCWAVLCCCTVDVLHKLLHSKESYTCWAVLSCSTVNVLHKLLLQLFEAEDKILKNETIQMRVPEQNSLLCCLLCCSSSWVWIFKWKILSRVMLTTPFKGVLSFGSVNEIMKLNPSWEWCIIQ